MEEGTGLCKTVKVDLHSLHKSTDLDNNTMETLESPPECPEVAADNGSRLFVPLQVKIELVMKAERVVRAEKSMSFRAFCRQHEVQPSQLRRWEKNLLTMKKTLENTRKKKTKVACTSGRTSRLAHLKDKLIPWVLMLRKDGKKVSIRMVAIYARKLDSTLRRERRYSLFAMVRRFLDSNGIVIRACTHKAQEDMRTKEDEARKFMETTTPLLQQPNRHQAFIINMDQTPYNPKDTEKKTLNERGVKTVNLKTMKTSLDRITCMLTVCADGTKLPPLLVFKAKPGGAVEREFTKNDFPKDCHYLVQENAWTDERVMLHWVDHVLAPYVKKAPKGIVPYLLLDKYTCHTQGTVTRKIEALGVEWDIIPGGCTGLVQPIDVGIGKPFKNRMRYCCEEWMMDQYTMDNGQVERIKPVDARRFVATWASHVWGEFSRQTVKNSWRHKPFSYFPEEVPETQALSDEEEESGDDEVSITGL